jgi:hypothetical protein
MRNPLRRQLKRVEQLVQTLPKPAAAQAAEDEWPALYEAFIDAAPDEYWR